MGDLNINLIDNDYEAENLLTVMSCLGLYQMISYQLQELPTNTASLDWPFVHKYEYV